MKKICVIGTALMLLAGTIHAQNGNGATGKNGTGGSIATGGARTVGAVHLGLEGGINLNNLYRSRDDDFKTSNMIKVGWHAGVIANIGANRFAFQPGLKYIQKGAQIESSYRDAFVAIEGKRKLTLHYIEMPLNFVYNFGYWGKSRMFLGAGPYVSVLMNAQDKHKIKTTVLETGATDVVEGQHKVPVGSDANAINTWDFGAGAFLGYQFAGGLYAKAGAQFGFVDLLDNAPSINSPYWDRNYNFLFSLGYMFGYRCCERK